MVEADQDHVTAALLAVQRTEAAREAITLEHRLTTIESAILSAGQASQARDATLKVTVDKIERQVEIANHRTGKLENWRTQVTAIYGALIIAGPFVFWALSTYVE